MGGLVKSRDARCSPLFYFCHAVIGFRRVVTMVAVRVFFSMYSLKFHSPAASSQMSYWFEALLWLLQASLSLSACVQLPTSFWRPCPALLFSTIPCSLLTFKFCSLQPEKGAIPRLQPTSTFAASVHIHAASSSNCFGFVRSITGPGALQRYLWFVRQ